jgi:hypothetical protein
MFKWVMALVIGLALFSFSTVASAQTGMQGYEYFNSTGRVTLQWDLIPEALGYNIRVIMFDKAPETTYAMGQTSNNQMEILRPRSGHFRFEAQACRFADCSCTDNTGATPENDCPIDKSLWAQSTDPTQATVDGVAMGWWLYWKTPPPIIIENF